MNVARQFVPVLCALITGCATGTAEMFPYWTDLDDAERDRYAMHLRVAGQRPLPASSRDRIVRLIWLRSTHDPIVLRADCNRNQSCSTHSVRLSGASGDEPGEPTDRQRRRLTGTESREVLRLLEDILSGPLPHDDPEFEMINGEIVEYVPADGSRWIVELVNAGGYRAISIHGAHLRRSAALSNLCELLVDRSGIEVSAFY